MMKRLRNRRQLPIMATTAALLIITASYVVIAPLDAERLTSVNEVYPHKPYTISEKANALHQSLTVADWHTDTLMWLRDIFEASDIGQVDLPRLEKANMAVQVFTSVTRVPDAGVNLEGNHAHGDKISSLAFTDKWPKPARTSLFQRATYHAQKLHDAEHRAPDKVRVILTKQDLHDVLEARDEGRNILGAVLGNEGLHPLEGNISNLKKLYDNGYRVMGLFHFFDNELGGSLHGVSNTGLSDFGKEVIKEMNRRGIIIDVAHASYKSVEDVLELAERPIILSHTGMRGVCESHRNIPDHLMKKIAEKGGVIGIGYWEAAICNTDAAKVVEHIRYAVDLLGVEHVSLGSDYDGSLDMPFDVSEIPALTQIMTERGFSEAEIRAIMGENIIRVLSEQLPEA